MDNVSVAIIFLMSTHSGITVEDTTDELLMSLIRLAFATATNEGAFNTIKTKGSFVEDKEKQLLEIIKKPPKQEDMFDYWHTEVCEKILSYYKKSDCEIRNNIPCAFTYGNAAKWLNMITKFMYIYRATLGYTTSKHDFCSFYDKNYAHLEKSFHIPIDSFIIEGLWNDDDTYGENNWIPGLDKSENKKDKRVGKYSTTKYTVWSKFKKEDYIAVQRKAQESAVNEGISRMEFENKLWVKISKKRKT